MNMWSKIIRTVIYTFILLLATSVVQGQYFGRNKVQYQDFDFQVLSTPHYDVYHYSVESRASKDAGFMLERWYRRYADFFSYDFPTSQPVILYANHADFQQTNAISGFISQGTGGVTEGYMNRMVIPLTGVSSDDNHVLGHELVHAFQYRLIKAGGKRLSSSRRLPTWFVEGMAEYLSIGREDPMTAMWMRDAVLNDDVPTIHEVMTERKYFPYRYGHALWGYLTGRLGDPIIKPLFMAVLNSGWNSAVKNVVGISSDSLSREWQGAIRTKYQSQIEGRTKPDSVGKQLITGEGGMNMGPVLSPDGERLVYISQRELFTLNLYLADAKTGKVIRKLTSSQTDAHFDALRFMDAAGAWAPDSKRFAFVVIKEGDNAISIVDVTTGKITRTITLKEVDGVQHLAWSPDGDKLLISGSIGGISDLFLYDMENGEVQQVTDTRYAEIQPSWAPDGETIVFATDRGPQTDKDAYIYSDMKIGIMDMQTHEVSLVSMGTNIKHINPHLSPNGGNIYFISDPDGISNIYRYELETGTFYRITNIATGVSGLTERSPALSVACKTGDLAFSVFTKTKYNIHTLSADSAVGAPYDSILHETRNSYVTLPPEINASTNVVDNFIKNKSIGLADTSEFHYGDYNPSLQLLRAAQGGVGLSVNQYGTGVAGGVNLVFSDMLGNHLLGVTLRARGSFKDIGGQVIYRNRDNRINWGGAVAHIPYRTSQGASRFAVDTLDGQPVQTRQVNILTRRTFYDRLEGVAEYPFSRNRRLEWNLGYTRIAYNLQSELITVLNGRVVDRETESLDTPDPLNLYSTALAYVGDDSYFGYTSPIKGKRYRFELEPTFGSLRYLSATADYRQYFFLRPFTFAFRGLHYGRYLEDSENQRLSPLQVGYRTWVRGYSLDSFDYQDCESGDCPEINRLVGSKVGIVNAEVRVPLFGGERLSLISFRFLPTELVAFLDGGVAWTKNKKPVWELARDSNKRVPVFSTGVAARVNLFGYLVGQVYYAYPLQRPKRGAHFGFVISPGW